MLDTKCCMDSATPTWSLCHNKRPTASSQYQLSIQWAGPNRKSLWFAKYATNW